MSVSSVSLNSDVNVRYQRLVTEYAKLRTQAKVLREGVIGERAKVEKITEELRKKEAAVRKLEAENESLGFRNEQLVKRVESLQNEVEHDSKKEKPSKKSASKDEQKQLQSMIIKIELLEGELRNKLKQNEELVSQIAESERVHNEEMTEMSEKFAKGIRSLEQEVETLRRRSVIDPFACDKPVEAVRPMGKIEIAEIGSPEPPESSEEAYLMIGETTKALLFRFSNFFTLLQQRTEIYPYDIKMEALPKSVELLASEYSKVARIFDETSIIIDDFLRNSQIEIEIDLPMFVEKVECIASRCHGVLRGLVQNMLIEENGINWCTPPLVALNEKWEELMERLFECFKSIRDVLVNRQSFGMVGEKLGELTVVTLGLSEVFTKRWLHESRLPTANKRMRCVGVALEEAVRQLNTEAAKLNARSRKVAEMLKSQNESAPESSNQNCEDEEELKTPVNKSANYNPFEEAEVENEVVKVVVKEDKCCQTNFVEKEGVQKNRSDEKDTITKGMSIEIEVLRERSSELQNERDKLNIDLTLIKRKFEIANGNQKYDGKEDVDHIFEIGKEMKKKMMNKLTKAECAARFYRTECEKLLILQISGDEKRAELAGEVQKINNDKVRIEDELTSVRRGYEMQIGELSDHMAALLKSNEQEKGKKEVVGNVQQASIPKNRIKSFFKS